jgi:hypothetical protein
MNDQPSENPRPLFVVQDDFQCYVDTCNSVEHVFVTRTGVS